MRAWLLLLALAGCDRVFGLGDPYEDARVSTDVIGDTGRPTDGDVRGDGMPTPVTEIAHFTFDDTLNDTSGTYIGTDIGSGITFTTGHTNKAVTLDGTSCLEVTIPDPLASFTIAFWAKPASTTGGTLMSRLGPSSALHSYHLYDSAAGGGFGFELLDNAGPVDGIYPSAFAVNTWRHYAVTYDGSLKTWFLDGSPVKNQTSGPITYGSVNDEYIACEDGSADYWAGAIDELYIFGGALSQAEIVALANQ